MKSAKSRYLVVLALLAAGCSTGPTDSTEETSTPPDTVEPPERPGLTPRNPVASSPLPTTLVPGQQYRLVAKFNDAMRARVTADRDVTFKATHGDTATVRSIAKQRGFHFAQAIDLPLDTLYAMQTRAAVESGVAQPDLAGVLEDEGCLG